MEKVNRKALLVIYQISLRPTDGWDQKIKVTERIRAVWSCFCKREPCEFCHLSCNLLPNQNNDHVFQPDFRFWKARFAGKQWAQSGLVISHCLTVPHSSNLKDSHMLLANIRDSKIESSFKGDAIYMHFYKHQNRFALDFLSLVSSNNKFVYWPFRFSDIHIRNI
jgi:hypothetical protein